VLSNIASIAPFETLQLIFESAHCVPVGLPWNWLYPYENKMANNSRNTVPITVGLETVGAGSTCAASRPNLRIEVTENRRGGGHR
jgi:hypothetical protein